MLFWLKKIFKNSIINEYKIFWGEILLMLFIICIFFLNLKKLSLISFFTFLIGLVSIILYFGMFPNKFHWVSIFILIQIIAFVGIGLSLFINLCYTPYNNSFINALKLLYDIQFLSPLLKQDAALLLFNIIVLIVKTIYCFLFSLVCFSLYLTENKWSVTKENTFLLVCSLVWIFIVILTHYTGFSFFFKKLIIGLLLEKETLLVIFFVFIFLSIMCLILGVSIVAHFGFKYFSLFSKLYALIVLNIIFTLLLLFMNDLWCGVFLPLLTCGFPLLQSLSTFCLIELSLVPPTLTMEDGTNPAPKTPRSFFQKVGQDGKDSVVKASVNRFSQPSPELRETIDYIAGRLPPASSEAFTQAVKDQQIVGKNLTLKVYDEIHLYGGLKGEADRVVSNIEIVEGLKAANKSSEKFLNLTPDCSKLAVSLYGNLKNAIITDSLKNASEMLPSASWNPNKPNSGDLFRGMLNASSLNETLAKSTRAFADSYINCLEGKQIASGANERVLAARSLALTNPPLSKIEGVKPSTFCANVFGRTASDLTPEERLRCYKLQEDYFKSLAKKGN